MATDMTGITVTTDSRGRDRYRVRVTFRDSEGVERCRTGTFDRQSDAVKARNKWRSERDKRDLMPRERMTVREYGEQWMRDNATGDDHLSDNTLAGYATCLKRINKVIGHVPVQDVKLRHVKSLRAELDEMRHARTGELLEKSTKATTMAVLHNLLAAAVEDELLDRNPAAAVRRRRRKKKVVVDDEVKPQVKKAFTAEEVAALRIAAREHRNDRLRLLVFIASFAGLRRSEVLGLRWKDLDIVETGDGERFGVLHVRSTLVWVGKKGPKYEPPKSDSGIRDATIDAETLDVLLEWRERQSEYKKLAGSKWYDDTGLIVTNHLGRPWQPNVASREFTAFAQGLGMDKTLHGLRHTYCSVLGDRKDEDGPTWVELSEQAGHADANMTMNTYSTTVQSDAGLRTARLMSATLRAATDKITDNEQSDSTRDTVSAQVESA